MEEKELEQAVARSLEGELKRSDPRQEALARLNPRYEVRVRTEKDPIVEETREYRSMAGEVDERYDAYMEAASKKEDEK